MNQDLAYLDATIADLEARRDHLNGMIESLKQIRDHGGAPVAAPGATGSSGSEHEVRHDSFFGMTLLDGMKKYLGITKQTRSAPDIADALLRGGMKSAAKDFVGNVRSTLSKNDEFVSVKNGEWGLSLWYPAKRKEKQPKASKAAKKAWSNAGIKVGRPQKKRTGAKMPSLKERAVLRHMNGTSGPLKPEVIAEALKFNFNTTRVMLYNLVKRGLIRRAEGGGYEKLTETKQAEA